MITTIFFISNFNFLFGKLLFATNVTFYLKSTSYSLVSIDNPFIDMQQFYLKLNATLRKTLCTILYMTKTSWFHQLNVKIIYLPMDLKTVSFNFQYLVFYLGGCVYLPPLLIKIYFDLIDAATEKYKYIIFFLS